MTLAELEERNGNDIIEVSGVQLGFQVSLLPNSKFGKDQVRCLLESYYNFLDQGKQNGFSSQYIQMTVDRARCIFKNANNLMPKCFKEVDKN